MKTVNDIREAIANETPRSAWDKAVKLYALELLDELNEAIKGGYCKPETLADGAALKTQMLNGAKDWNQYSWGGCSLVYDCDIAERVCSPSELKKRHGGDWKPNREEDWLDVQARALAQAARKIRIIAR